MTTLVKLRLLPEGLNSLCLRDRRKTSSFRRGSYGGGGVSVKSCRAFRTEEGGDLKGKKHQNLKKSEVELKKENGFWSSVNSVIKSTFMVGSNSEDEYRLAMAKVEEVLSSVSLCLFFIF